MVDNVANAINNSKYYTAFNHILSLGGAAKRAFVQVVQNTVTDEVQQYSKSKKTNFPQLNGLASVANFSWNKIIDPVQEQMPTYHAALAGSFDVNRRRKKKDAKKEENHRYDISGMAYRLNLADNWFWVLPIPIFQNISDIQSRYLAKAGNRYFIGPDFYQCAIPGIYF